MRGYVDIDTLSPLEREILEKNEPTFREKLKDFALGFLTMGIIIAVAAVLNYYIVNDYINMLFGIICGFCGFVATLTILLLVFEFAKVKFNSGIIKRGGMCMVLVLSTSSAFFSFCEVRAAYDGPRSSFGIDIVYVTRYGYAYHRKNCDHLKNTSAIPTFRFLTRKQACLDCKP